MTTTGAPPGALARALGGISSADLRSPRELLDSGWLDDRYDAELRALDRIDARYAGAVTDLPAVQAWAEDVLLGSGRWLLLQGVTGTGKTHQAMAALRIVSAAGGAARWAGGTEAELLGRLRRLWPSDAAETLLDEWAGAPLLLVDDLGASKGSEWTEEVLYRVLNRRYNALLPCLITSNLPDGALAAHLGDRVASRVVEASSVVVLDGPDRRRS